MPSKVKPKRLLIKGDEGADVRWMQSRLWKHGKVAANNPFFAYAKKKYGILGPEDPRAQGEWEDGDFGDWSEIALMDFQATHLGERGIPLDEISKMGVCDRDVLLALAGETPVKQDTGHKHDGEADFNSIGDMIIQTWSYYIGLNIKENRGNNRGPWMPSYASKILGAKALTKNGGIDAWTGYNPKKPQVRGPAWCCYVRCGIEREVHGIVYNKLAYVNSGKKEGLCYANYLWGTKQVMSDNDTMELQRTGVFHDIRGWVVDKQLVIDGKIKLPVGTAMIMNYGGRTGHTGTVAKVIYKGNKATDIICCEGNISNTMDWRRRKLTQSSIKWFIVAPILLQSPNFKGIGKSDVKLTGGSERTR